MTSSSSFRTIFYQEVISGLLPYAHVTRDIKVMNPAMANITIMLAIRGKKLPPEPPTRSSEKDVLWGICIACWDYIPEERPTVGEVIAILTDFITTRNVTSSESISSGGLEPENPVGELAKNLNNFHLDGTGISLSCKGTIRIATPPNLDLSSVIEYQNWTSFYNTGHAHMRTKLTIKDAPPRLTLVSHRFSTTFQVEWQIHVDSPSPLTSHDILKAIYASLFHQVTPDEKKRMDNKSAQSALAEAEKARARRCRLAGKEDSLRRVDFLKEYRWLKGIRILPKETDAYLLVTHKSQEQSQKDTDL